MAAVGAACGWLADYRPSGVWRVLRRLGLSWQRARAYVPSPDPDYDTKLAVITDLLAAAALHPGQLVVLFQDEVTIERQPSLAPAYAPRGGRQQPRAHRSQQSNTLTRITATLDPASGRVCYQRASHIRIPTLVRFYRELVTAYPDATRIYLVQDNWPVHFHPDLLVALEPQRTTFPLSRPPSWPSAPHPAAVRQWEELHLPIQLVPLPTYASWCNPIEKLWRYLKQTVTHLHPWADDLPCLRQEVDTFLDRFATGSRDLLRYVGLLVPG